MKFPLTADVLLVGGGLVGATLANILASNGLSVFLFEKQLPSKSYQLESDGRAIAVAQTIKIMLDCIGVWTHIVGEETPILDIRVVDDNSNHYLHFDHEKISNLPLGFMVENQTLHKAIIRSLSGKANVQQISITEPFEVIRTSGQIDIVIAGGKRYSGRVLVGADGRNSLVREYAKIPLIAWPYRQTALISAIDHEKPHDNVAYELFYPSGPLAVLPLRGNRSSIVWTESNTNAQSIATLSDTLFMSELERRIGTSLGKLRNVSPRTTFPLSLQFSKALISHRIALVGDAAHGIHPIAGQGFNLGLRDVAVLAEKLVEAHRLGLDLGSLVVLKNYERWRSFDNTVMIGATDILNRLFSTSFLPVKKVRNYGLSLVNSSGVLKQIFMKQAMGLSGSLPKLLKGEPI